MKRKTDGYNNLRSVIVPRLDELGWSIERLSQEMERAGTFVSRSAIYFWLNDTRRPLPALARACAQALGLPDEALLSAYSPRQRSPWTKRIGFQHKAGA